MNDKFLKNKSIYEELQNYCRSYHEIARDGISVLEIYITSELSAEKKSHPFPELHERLASSRYQLLSSALQTLRRSKNEDDFFEKYENSFQPHQLNWNMLATKFSLKEMDQISIDYLNNHKKNLEKLPYLKREPMLPFGRYHDDWIRCRSHHVDGDTFFDWSASLDKWSDQLFDSFKQGYCLVRKNRIIDSFEIGGGVII